MDFAQTGPTVYKSSLERHLQELDQGARSGYDATAVAWVKKESRNE
jgi:hypothetical protein